MITHNACCRSLKYYDLRLIDSGFLHRSTVETEIGSVACYLCSNAAIYKSWEKKSIITSSVRSSFGKTYIKRENLDTGVVNDTVKGTCDGKCNLSILSVDIDDIK